MNNYFSITRKLQMLTVILIMTVTLILLCSVRPDSPAEMPAFSVESGFYKDAFYLEISAADGCSVYYTLDGSTPNEHSTRYSGPIYIDDASKQENSSSMRTDLSPMNTGKPDFLIDKCTVVRAIAITDPGEKMENSSVVTKSYFVGFEEGYFDNCSVISLATDPENLFDYETGIYVTGKHQDQFLEDGLDALYPPYYWSANYWQKGREWEREANLTFFDAEGMFLLSKEAGIRIQGGASRAYVPRSLNLYAREEYDAEGCFAIDFFDNGYQPTVMTLSVSGNQLVTRFNDYFMAQCVGEPVYSTMNYRPCVLFLNGEYWGFYWLTEKYDTAYIQHRYALSDTDVIMIKNDEVAEGYEGDYGIYARMVSYITTNDMSEEENYAQACQLIDMDSYIDYYATMIYIARSLDWPGYNEAMWRSRNVSEKPFEDGKWRWMMFDCNSESMSENLIEHDTLYYVIQWSPLFASLWENETFRTAFEKRILEVADTCFSAEKVNMLIGEYRETMKAPLAKTWARFNGRENDLLLQYHATLDSVQAFFNARRSVVEAWFT